MRLELEECWQVTYLSANDGHRLHCGGFFVDSKKDKAEERAKTLAHGRVVRCSLWRDSDGKYYYFELPKPVGINLPTRGEALSKLGPEDREVLGIG